MCPRRRSIFGQKLMHFWTFQGFGGNSGGPNNQPGSSQQGGNFLNWMNQGGAGGGGGSGVNDGGQQVNKKIKIFMAG